MSVSGRLETGTFFQNLCHLPIKDDVSENRLKIFGSFRQLVNALKAAKIIIEIWADSSSGHHRRSPWILTVSKGIKYKYKSILYKWLPHPSPPPRVPRRMHITRLWWVWIVQLAHPVFELTRPDLCASCIFVSITMASLLIVRRPRSHWQWE